MDWEAVFHPDLLKLITDIQTDSILSRVVYKDTKTEITLFGFAPGQELSEHTSSSAAIIEVLFGEAGATLGKQTVDLKPGAWVYLPPQLPHSISARSKFIMLLTLIKQ